MLEKDIIDDNTKINLINSTKKLYGIEIGGPSNNRTSKIIYQHAHLLDNVVFSQNTIWANQDKIYKYYKYKNKNGKTIINDSVNISDVNNNIYDFCYSCHSLEHIANPLKAISEWLRIIKLNAFIIILLPEKSQCFDHKRPYSTFDTLLTQYQNNVGEDDLSTLPEILKYHDLNMDPMAGTYEQFKQRSLDNFNNRCLHHYIYSENLLKQICIYFNCKFIYYNVIPDEGILFIMKKI